MMSSGVGRWVLAVARCGHTRAPDDGSREQQVSREEEGAAPDHVHSVERTAHCHAVVGQAAARDREDMDCMAKADTGVEKVPLQYSGKNNFLCVFAWLVVLHRTARCPPSKLESRSM